MPTNVSDVDAWTDPVVAPSGGDLRRSESVLQPVQHLANRTRYLLNEHVISPPAVGSTTDSLNPTGWSDATVVMLQTSSIVGFLNGANASVRQARKTIVNAGSFPLAFVNDGTTTGSKFVTPSGQANYILYAGNSVDIVLVSGVWRVLDAQPTFANTNVNLGGTAEVLYADLAGAIVPRARKVMLPLESISGAQWKPSLTSGALETSESAALYQIGVRLPGFSTLTGVRVLIEHGSATGSLSAHLYKSVSDTSAPYGASSNSALGVAGSPTSAGFHLLELSLSEVIQNDTTAYTLKVLSSFGAPTTPDRLHWIELAFSDPGPRNY